jgi:hypothetical protein
MEICWRKESSGSGEEWRIANVWTVELNAVYCVDEERKENLRDRRQWILYDLLVDRAVGTYLPKRNLDGL